MEKAKGYRTVTLQIKGEKITAEKLRHSIGAFYGLIDEIASEVAGQRKPIQWIVTTRKGSIILTNEVDPIKDLSPSVIDMIFENINKGVSSLEREDARPMYFSDRALEFLQELASIPKERSNGLTEINIKVEAKSHKLTPKIILNIDSILGVYSKALGSIEGRLSTISERGTLRFILYESLTDKAIRCNISDELLPEAMKGFRKRAYVYGLINYDKNGSPKSINVQDLRVFPEREKLPSAFEICGILEV
jgi:hypothetical protein